MNVCLHPYADVAAELRGGISLMTRVIRELFP